MRATATLIAFLMSTLVPVSALRAQGADDEPLDIGIPDEEPPPDDGGGAEEPPPEDEPVVRDPKMAKKLAEGAAKIVKAGDKLLKKKKVEQAHAEYARAIPAYLRSFELNPDAKILVIVAGLEEKLQLWAEARAHYVQALAETELPLDAKARAKAEAGVDNTGAYLGVVSLVILPEGATVLLDGTDIGPAPLAAPLVLKPGEYTLSISAETFLPLETKLVVDAGSESERTFELEAEPVEEYVPPPYVPPPPAPEPPPPSPSKLVLIIGAGATLAFTIGAVSTGIIAVGKHNTFTDPEATDQEIEDAQASGPTMAALTDAFTAAAVVAAGATVFYYLKIYSPKVKERDRLMEERAAEGGGDELTRREIKRRMPKVIVAPSVQDGGGGLVVTGWF